MDITFGEKERSAANAAFLNKLNSSRYSIAGPHGVIGEGQMVEGAAVPSLFDGVIAEARKRVEEALAIALPEHLGRPVRRVEDVDRLTAVRGPDGFTTYYCLDGKPIVTMEITPDMIHVRRIPKA